MLPEVAAFEHNIRYHKDVWDAIPEYEKQNNLIIALGWKEDEKTGAMVPDVIKIPRGDFVKIMGNPIRHFLEHLHNNKPNSLARVSFQMLSDASPIDFASQGKPDVGAPLSQTLPPPMRAVAQHVTGKNLGTGIPLLPARMENVTDKKQLYIDQGERGATTNAGKLVSRATGSALSPIHADMYLKTMFGNFIPTLLDPGALQGSFSRRFTNARGDAPLAAVREAEQALRGEDANAAIRIEHIFHQIAKTGSPQAVAQLDSAIREAAAQGIAPETLQTAIQSAMLRVHDSTKKLTPQTRALLELATNVSKNHLARYFAIKQGAIKPPINYPENSP